jgi:hypothetical protein
MLSSDYQRLLSVVFDDPEGECSTLHKQTLETLSFHEGVYSDSESLLVYHQLVDLPMHILLKGPIRGWWALPGERSLHSLKLQAPKGGVKQENIVMRRYCGCEESRTNDAYDFDLGDIHRFTERIGRKRKLQESINNKINMNVVDGRMEYTDIGFAFGPSSREKCALNNYEFNQLLLALKDEVQKQSRGRNDALRKSALYRLFHAFKHHRASFEGDFGNWYTCLYKWFCDPRTVNVDMAELFKKYVTDEKLSAINATDLSKRFCNNGIILQQDRTCIRQTIKFAEKIATHHQAYIYGIKFRGRGWEGREIEEPKREEQRYGAQTPSEANCRPIKDINFLKTTWSSKYSMASWCRYKYKKPAKDSMYGTTQTGTNNAQINAFFYITIIGEPVLNGVPFASVCSRKYKLDRDRINSVDCDDLFSYKERIFTATTNIFCTPIILAPFDNSQLPLRMDKKDPNVNMYSRVDSFANIDHLVLIDMMPHRCGIEYFIENNIYYNKPQ